MRSSGDAEAFGILYQRYANRIYAYCFRRTADWFAADELTSVVFLETWRRRRRIVVDSGELLPWLLGVATNAIRNHRRSLRRHRAALERLPRLQPERDFAEDLADRLTAQAQMKRVLDEVQHLPTVEQEALALCAWEGMSSRSAALALGVPEGTVRTRLMRARARLRSAIDDSSGSTPNPSAATSAATEVYTK